MSGKPIPRVISQRRFLPGAHGAIILCLSLVSFPVSPLAAASAGYASFEIQHPLPGAVLPLNMPLPVLLWNTNVPGVDWWAARFTAGGQNWSFEGIQPRWRPPETDWGKMKLSAKGGAIEFIVAGYERGAQGQKKAESSVRFVVSADAVKTPLFYRDVNLPFLEAVKDPSKIRWRFGSLETGQLPPVVLEKMPVCGNCHSFSRNGEYLAMDVDYANNKGSYVITKTGPQM